MPDAADDRSKRPIEFGENTGRPGVVMVKQAHGGALQVGNPGNAGGGRTADRVKLNMVNWLDKSLDNIFARQAEGKELGVDEMRLLELCSKHTLAVPKVLVSADVEGRLQRTYELFRAEFGGEPEVLARIEKVYREGWQGE